MMVNYWFNIPRKYRFILIGGFNAFVSYVLYSGYCLLFGNKSYQTALIFAWMLSSVISFVTQKLLVFRTYGNWIKEYLKCLSTWALGYLINAGLLEISVKYLGLNIFIAQIIATGLTAVFTYILFKKFAFKPD